MLITLTFSCQHDQLVGVHSDRLKNWCPRHGSGKKGVLGTGQARKKGGLRHGSGQKRGGLYCGTYTCTGHICECPPPPAPGGGGGGLAPRGHSRLSALCSCITHEFTPQAVTTVIWDNKVHQTSYSGKWV